MTAEARAGLSNESRRVCTAVLGSPDPALQDEWDELARATGAAPWMRPGWLVPWYRHMSTGAPLIITCRTTSGRLTGVLPLQRTRAALLSATNWHTPDFDLVAADDPTRTQLLREAMRQAGPRLVLGFVSAQLADDVEAEALRDGRRPVRRVLERSPWLSLQGDWEGAVDKHVRSELRRRGRRLAERGAIRLDLHDGTRDLDALLHDGYTVEASGWKGRERTAIASNPETRGFYTDVARWAAAEGLLRLLFLRLDDRALAFDYVIEHDRVQYLLKTGFLEQERAVGPGQQLRLLALRDCATRGVLSYEMLGDAVPWKRSWTNLVRERLQVQVFARSARGTCGFGVHRWLLPAARAARAAVRERTGPTA